MSKPFGVKRGEFTSAVRRPRHFAHFEFNEPNEFHQADTLFMPNDRGYKYVVTVIDGYSRYGAAIAMKTKDSRLVAKALKTLYETETYLKKPKVLRTDKGTEFAQVHTLGIPKHETAEVGNHRAMSLVERFNRTFVEPIMDAQTTREMEKVKQRVDQKERQLKRELTEEEFDNIYTSTIDRKWVGEVDKRILDYNAKVHRTLGASPLDVMKGNAKPKDLETIPDSAKRVHFHVGDTVRVATDPPDRGWRAGDVRWSYYEFVVYRIKEATAASPPVYYVINARTFEPVKSGFYAEELKKVDKPTPVNL